jgi:hypothetical protein
LRTSLILLSRTYALYICYSVDAASEKCFYSEKLSVGEIRIRHIRGVVLRRAIYADSSGGDMMRNELAMGQDPSPVDYDHRGYLKLDAISS